MRTHGTVQVLSHDTSSDGSLVSGIWTELDSALDKRVSGLQVHNGSNQPIQLAVGPSGSESAVLNVPASSVGELLPLSLDAGQRLSAQSLDSAASSGFVLINFF